jgi:hypothetical protein
MKKYYVAVEATGGMAGIFGSVLGFSVKYFEVTLAPDTPVTAKTFYDIINKDVTDEYKKTGNVIAWSVIDEKTKED